jgi:hypothetical protein
MRPAGEQWSVTMAETATTVRLDFARYTDALRSITIASDGDDGRLWFANIPIGANHVRQHFAD